MPATKPLYDLVLMLDSAAESARREEIVASAEQIVAAGGEVVNKQDWGPRQMAFEIRHKKDADYHLLQFHATRDVLERLDRQLRIVDEVVRYRIVKLAPGTPPPVEQRAEPRPVSVAAAAEPVAEAEPVVAEAEPATEAEPVATPEAVVPDAAPDEPAAAVDPAADAPAGD